ncbi:hypothetical protein C7S17_4358 [Burkholderia thailandensis]|nr:hypothetical protein [Burkholderia thailandensis]
MRKLDAKGLEGCVDNERFMSFERCRRFQDRSDARRMQGGRRACGKGAARCAE